MRRLLVDAEKLQIDAQKGGWAGMRMGRLWGRALRLHVPLPPCATLLTPCRAPSPPADVMGAKVLAGMQKAREWSERAQVGGPFTPVEPGCSAHA